MSVLDRSALEASPLADLHAIASELSIDGYRRLRRAELIDAILDKQEGGERRPTPTPTPRGRHRPGAGADGGRRASPPPKAGRPPRSPSDEAAGVDEPADG